jgi:hypothetical protein
MKVEMSYEYFDTLLWGRFSMGMEKYTPNRARFFVCKKYTTFSTKQIVALRSVNKISPKSYDFAARTFYDTVLTVFRGTFWQSSVERSQSNQCSNGKILTASYIESIKCYMFIWI